MRLFGRKTIFLHIGMPKTGTTSIQHRVYAHRQTLAEDHDILYPEACLASNTGEVAHHNLSRAMRGLPDFDPAAGTLDTLLQEIKNAPQQKILISSEGLWDAAAADFEAFENLIRALGRVGNVHIVLFLRAEADFMESVYLQSIRGLHTRFPLDIYIAKLNERLRQKTRVLNGMYALRQCRLTISPYSPATDSLKSLMRMIAPNVTDTFEIQQDKNINRRWGINIYRALYKVYCDDPAAFRPENSQLKLFRNWLPKHIDHGERKFSIIPDHDWDQANAEALDFYRAKLPQRLHGLQEFLEHSSWSAPCKAEFYSLDNVLLSEDDEAKISAFLMG